MRHKVISIFFKVNLAVTFLCLIVGGIFFCGPESISFGIDIVLYILFICWAAWIIVYITYGILEIRSTRKKNTK